MIEQNVINLIGTLGFPIVMVLWFMFRTEKIIENNTKAMNKMSDKYDLHELNRGLKHGS